MNHSFPHCPLGIFCPQKSDCQFRHVKICPKFPYTVQPSRTPNQTIRTLKVRQGDKRSLQQLPGTEVSLQDTEDGIASPQPPALE